MHCAFCPSDVLRRRKEHLSESNLKSFLGQVHALGIRAPVMLNVLGEPLLNKRVYPLLDELQAAGHAVTLITNMTLLGDPGVRRELLRHDNLTLAMSFQTATPRSYVLRGYDRMPFREFGEIFLAVVEDKFRLQSGTRLELHVASNFVLTHDPTIQADGAIDLWANFASERAERRWIVRTLRRLERLARRMERRYPDAFTAAAAAASAKYHEHIGREIVVERSKLPEGFQHLKEDAFWGYMALPDVFLVFKSLELWTRDRDFLRAALPPGRFAYVEERVERRPCSMADSLGLLANGDLILCCLDYEGEMGLGNIGHTSVADVLLATKRAAVRRDAMAEALCRRCRGNLFVFATEALPGRREQAVDKFGRGFWPYESGLHALGGRWTDGCGWAYVFTRIPARRVRLSFWSGFPNETQFALGISLYDPLADDFPAPAAAFAFSGRENERDEFEAAFAFLPGRLYRLEVRSTHFFPNETLGNDDQRRLGLAVFSIAILS
ncbi:MAG: SPASM domain-containing protein [Acidobacteria bacterium]|jgi:hypothetical protein|nr:SPASM domain-containing protein [Acidobacteriota bacterium]